MPYLKPAFDLDRIRSEIPALERTIPMNACSQTPLTASARRAAAAFLDSWDRSVMDWNRWLEEVEGARRTFAELIGAAPEEVAIFSSVSHAASAVASCLDLLAARRNRRVIAATDAEFPSVGHVWSAQVRRGLELRWIPVRAGCVRSEDLLDRLDDEVLLLSATHAYFITGALLDLDLAVQAARDAGAITFVDAYQSLGAIPVNVRQCGVDMLASGSLKFLMGTPGIAFLYVRRDLADELEPAVTGWFGRADPMAFDPRRLDWAAGARRFDGGTPPILPAAIANAGMRLLIETGLEDIRDWTMTLAGRLSEGGAALGFQQFGPRDPAQRSPVTAFHAGGVPGGADAVEERLRDRGIIATARGEVIRLAPHFFNSIEDVDRTLGALEEVLR